MTPVSVVWGALASVFVAAAIGCAPVSLFLEAPEITLRPEDERPPPTASGRLIIVGIDGLRRDVLLDALRAGQLPGFERLLGGRAGEDFPHAYLHERTIAPFPSVTASGWAAMMTGRPPADNGVTGNEMLLRPAGEFVAPVPMSVTDRSDLLAVYDGQLFNRLLAVPTIYDRAHERGQRSWVAFSHVHAGADRLLLPGKGDLLEGLMESMMAHVAVSSEKESYHDLDRGTIASVVESLDEADFAPNLLTVYLAGPDLVGHVQHDPVGRVQRDYLRATIDEGIGELLDALEPHGPWHRVLIADHGHTEVVDDDAHALAPRATGTLGDVLEGAGFAVREPALGKVRGRDDTVIGYQSGAAFVYLADRSTCGDRGCRWDVPPRFREDVLPAAAALSAANHGEGAMAGAIDLVLVREPVPFDQRDRPFVAYLEDGSTVDLASHLAERRDPDVVALAERVDHLAVGRHGERAGDLVVVAHCGDRPDDRFYFAKGYGSTHGSATASDSFVPFFVAHPGRTSRQIRATVRSVVGQTAHLHELAPLFDLLATDGVAR